MKYLSGRNAGTCEVREGGHSRARLHHSLYGWRRLPLLSTEDYIHHSKMTVSCIVFGCIFKPLLPSTYYTQSLSNFHQLTTGSQSLQRLAPSILHLSDPFICVLSGNHPPTFGIAGVDLTSPVGRADGPGGDYDRASLRQVQRTTCKGTLSLSCKLTRIGIVFMDHLQFCHSVTNVSRHVSVARSWASHVPVMTRRESSSTKVLHFERSIKRTMIARQVAIRISPM
jgi:hypothetical protein